MTTIFGDHSVSDLRDLLNSYDYQSTQLASSSASAASAWDHADSVGHATWLADYAAWDRAYEPYRDAANTLLAATPIALQGITSAETQYQALATAFAPFADLDRRMRAAPTAVAALAPDYSSNPQPVATDVQLAGLQLTDAATRGMPDIVKAAIGNLAPGLAPKNADSAAYAPMSATEKVLLVVGALFGIALFVKVAK